MIRLAKKRPLCLICIGLILLILFAKLTGLPIFGEPPENSVLTAEAEGDAAVKVVGTVSDRVKKAHSIQYILSNSYLRSEKENIPLYTISLISTREEQISVGSFVCVYGSLSVPEQASNPGQFDLRDYYASQGIYYSVYADSITVLEEHSGFRERTISVRNALTDCLEQLAAEEEVEILKAMILGDRTGLSEEMKRNYQVGGILHILAISGMHISLLGMALFRLLQKVGLSVRISAPVSFGALAGYCYLTGCAPSSVRAVLMFGISLGAKLLLRTYDPLCALACAGILMLLENPSVLFMSGFQLSFAAIVAVSAIWPSVSWLLPRQIKKPGKKHGRAGMQEKEKKELARKGLEGWIRYYWRRVLHYGFFWFTINVTLLPLTVWYYYEIPVWGLLPNLLLVPAAPVILVSGILGILTGIFHVGAGRLVITPAVWILQVFAGITNAIRNLPFATIVCGKPALWQVVAAGTAVSVLAIVLQLKKGKGKGRSAREQKEIKVLCRKLTATVMAVTLLLLLFRWGPMWSLALLDVGQGDCIILKDRTTVFLVDGGSSSTREVGKQRILPYLKSQGISHLNGIFLTHPDEDHLNGILEVLEAVAEKRVTMTVETLYLPCWMEDSEEEKEVAKAARAAGAELLYLSEGDCVQTGTMNLTVLNPLKKGGITSGNSGSLVLDLSCGNFRALLTGDLESDGEARMLPLYHRYDFLKAAHHGSKGSSSERFLQEVQPLVVGISAPENSRYGHPHQETLERFAKVGASVYVTRDCGAIFVEGNKEKWQIRGFLQTKEADMEYNKERETE